MTTVGASALLMAFTCSCRSAPAPQPAPPLAAPPPVSAPAAAPALEVPAQSDTLGPPEQQFLVHLGPAISGRNSGAEPPGAGGRAWVRGPLLR